MRKIIFLSAVIIGVSLLFSSCKKDESMGNNNITSVTYDAAFKPNGLVIRYK